jgi:hypothetical protein
MESVFYLQTRQRVTVKLGRDDMLFRLIRTSIGNDAIVILDYNGTSNGRYDLVFKLVRPHSNERLSKHAPISYSCEPSGVVFKL